MPLVGVLDAIARGLSLVLIKPYLLIVPILLDLALWLCVQISIVPLTNAFGRMLSDYGGQDGPEAADEVARFGEWLRLNDLVGFFVPSIFAGLPKETSFNWLVTLLAPALTAGVDRNDMFGGYGEGPIGVWTPPHSFAVISLAGLVLLASSILLILFRVPIARAVRGAHGTTRGIVTELGRSWVHLIALLAIATGAGVIAIIPIALILVVSLLFGSAITALVAFGIVGVAGIAAIYTYFVLDAMLLYRVGPIHAIRASYMVTRNRFGECFRFALTAALIQTGLLQVWHVLIENPPGLAIALLGNAFVGAGIAAASMIFFSDRLQDAERSHHAQVQSQPA